MLFLGIVNDGQFRKFCALVGREDLARDPRFASNPSRLANRPALRAAIEAALSQEQLEPLCERLMAAGVPAGAVRSVSQAMTDPHARHRGLLVERGNYRGIGAAQKLSRTPATVRSAPPAFAADTRDVLAEAGYSPNEIESLVQSGVTPLERRAQQVPLKEVQ
jgi:formyl-CoA transferase